MKDHATPPADSAPVPSSACASASTNPDFLVVPIRNRRPKLAGGQRIQGTEAILELGRGQASLPEQTAYKLLGRALPFNPNRGTRNAGQPARVRSNLKNHATKGGANRESSCGDVSAGVRRWERGCPG